MNCEQAQSLLLSYLDGEVTPSERALILAHLSNCTVCQQELDLLSTARSRVRSALQRRAVQAVPSQEAWRRLETQLTEAAQPSSRFRAWFSHSAPDAKRASILKFFGGVPMYKKLIASAFGMLAVVSIVVILLVRSVTPVSAQQILDRAYQAQSQPVPIEGIGHIRSEVYSNPEALPEDQGMQTVIDSYSDLQTGYFRLVITDRKTDKVLDATAYDGMNSYSQGYRAEATGDGLLTIYRTPQNQVDLKPAGSTAGVNESALFEQMRDDPHVVSVRKETWEDGRPVYVLQSQQPVKALLNGQTERPNGSITMYFDAHTYKQLGYRMTMEKDGQEILLASQKILADEILPAETNVPWDLSDVQGITIVDDPDRQYGDLLPEVLTSQEASENAAAKNQTIYLLKEVPEGYSLEMSAPPQQSESEFYLYGASYTGPNDSFGIQAASPADVQAYKEAADEIYTTVSGLVITFTKDSVSSSTGITYVDALVEAPDGTAIMLSSDMPREMVKAWAEELVPVPINQ